MPAANCTAARPWATASSRCAGARARARHCTTTMRCGVWRASGRVNWSSPRTHCWSRMANAIAAPPSRRCTAIAAARAA
ncbi:hypothetical protein G6F51_014512 [Rhizopus arrhizus]|uniref:Uncharacterized protein n=1 Tax=Rhizopus oryzae TaxID=64495 RepID=A0A9P6XLL1_RHIOR|nr:hypothetical protein G6F51_014512 [Rhizopus arrhizus]